MTPLSPEENRLFDEHFSVNGHEWDYLSLRDRVQYPEPDDVKSFIASALQRERERLMGEIEGMKVLLHIDEHRGDNIGVEERWGTGYNQALDEVIKLISSDEEKGQE